MTKKEQYNLESFKLTIGHDLEQAQKMETIDNELWVASGKNIESGDFVNYTRSRAHVQALTKVLRQLDHIVINPK